MIEELLGKTLYVDPLVLADGAAPVTFVNHDRRDRSGLDREAGEKRVVRGDDNVGRGDLGPVALLRAGTEEVAAVSAGGTGGLVHLEACVHRCPDGGEVGAHRDPCPRVDRLVAAQHRNARAVAAPLCRGLVGQCVRGDEDEQSRWSPGRFQSLAQRQQMAAGGGALAEADRCLDADPRTGFVRVGMPRRDPGARRPEQDLELLAGRLGREVGHPVVDLDRGQGAGRKPALREQPQLVDNLPFGIAARVRPAVRSRTVKVGGGGEAFPDGSGEIPGIGSIGTGSDRVMYGVIGDRRQPAVAAVDDAALLVADEAGRRFPLGGFAGGGRSARHPRQQRVDLDLKRLEPAGIDERQRIERHVERAIVDPAVWLKSVGVDAVGDELLAQPEELDLRSKDFAAEDLGDWRLSPKGQQPLRPEPDPGWRIAEPQSDKLVDLMCEIGIEHVDIDADQRAGPQADAMVGILMCPAGDRGLIDQNLGPAGQRRPLRAGHDRQRFVTVVEEAERRGAVACPSADRATAGRLWVFRVRWRGCVPRRHRGAVLGRAYDLRAQAIAAAAAAAISTRSARNG